MIRAVLSNAAHPKYGVITVSFPIPREQYDGIMNMLGELEIGNAVKRDCRVDEISDDWPILKRLEKVAVNIDEMDYLAKRLDSFDVGEAAQFQAMAVKMGVSDMTNFINLTFCCQQATVIMDFSDLKKIGRDHLMNLNGGCMPTAELERADTRMAALKLILHEEGTITPYGVVYDNGMQLEQHYDGQHLPAYLYEPCIMMVEMTAGDADAAGDYLYLPTTQTQIERAMLRAGIDSHGDMQLRFMESELPEELDALLDMEQENLSDLNELCAAMKPLDSAERTKLAAVAEYAHPQCAAQIRQLAANLARYDFVPGAKTPEDYGRYMIQKSGHFEYDENLTDYYDYGKYGQERMDNEEGSFIDGGYVSYHGVISMDELMQDGSCEQAESGMQMG